MKIWVAAGNIILFKIFQTGGGDLWKSEWSPFHVTIQVRLKNNG